jgi:uncharacterized protein YebE (UPF0316 family)
MTPLFLVGVFEMLIVTAWTKYVTRAQVWASGMVTIVNILIWYYVLEKIVNNLNDVSLVVSYAIGCAIGTMIGTYWIGRNARNKKTRDDIREEFRVEYFPKRVGPEAVING